MFLLYITSMQRSNKSLQFSVSAAMMERILSFSFSRTDSSTMPLLSIRYRKRAYFSIVFRFSFDTSIERVPLGFDCILYIVLYIFLSKDRIKFDYCNNLVKKLFISILQSLLKI